MNLDASFMGNCRTVVGPNVTGYASLLRMAAVRSGVPGTGAPSGLVKSELRPEQVTSIPCSRYPCGPVSGFHVVNFLWPLVAADPATLLHTVSPKRVWRGCHTACIQTPGIARASSQMRSSFRHSSCGTTKSKSSSQAGIAR
eukprot:scaffold48164_cov68-Phaeocystis_antarctica.AAC.4